MPVPASTPLPKPLFLLISRDVRFIVPSQNRTLSCELFFSFSLRPHLTLLGNPVLGPFSLLFNWINSSSLVLSALLHTAQCKCPARPLMEVRWGHWPVPPSYQPACLHSSLKERTVGPEAQHSCSVLGDTPCWFFHWSPRRNYKCFLPPVFSSQQTRHILSGGWFVCFHD